MKCVFGYQLNDDGNTMLETENQNIIESIDGHHLMIVGWLRGFCREVTVLFRSSSSRANS